MNEKIFYMNGNKDSELKIVENSTLYDWLLANKYINDVGGADEELVFSEQALIELENADTEFSDEESVLIGYLIFHFEYNQGYIFK